MLDNNSDLFIFSFKRNKNPKSLCFSLQRFNFSNVHNKSKEHAELRLKPYSPLAVVLWFTLTQHEETSWARLDGLKERKRPGEVDQKTCEREEKNKRVVKTWYPDWYFNTFGLRESTDACPFVLFPHYISLHCAFDKTWRNFAFGLLWRS